MYKRQVVGFIGQRRRLDLFGAAGQAYHARMQIGRKFADNLRCVALGVNRDEKRGDFDALFLKNINRLCVAGIAMCIRDRAYSVAEHSILVEEIFTRQTGSEPKWQLAALLHDAPEYVIGDMISPVKAAIGSSYGELDLRLTAAVHLRFGLPAVLPVLIKKAIKSADRISAWLEAVQIAGFSEPEADKLFGRPDSALLRGLEIKLRPPAVVRTGFVERHRALMAAL